MSGVQSVKMGTTVDHTAPETWRAFADEADRPKVAHFVLPYLFQTGSWIYAQLVHLRRYRPMVLTDRTENLDVFPFQPIYSYECVSVWKKAMLCLWRPRRHGVSWLFFERIVRREHPCLMHGHFGTCGVELLELKRRLDLPMITAFYGADVSQAPRDPRFRQRYRQLFEEGELFLAEGNAMRRALGALGCPSAKIVVQHLGVDIEALPFVARRPDPSGLVRILIAATFREKKGIPDALRAVDRVRRRYPRLAVTLIGDSAGKVGDEDEKRTICGLLEQLDGVVTWIGFVPYPAFRTAILTHHLFLSPSVTARDGDSEGGAPVSIIEAEATGMPILSTLHADIPEVVVDGKSGLLSQERDVDSLAENLERLVAEPDLWEQMGRCGRRHVEENYNVRRQVARLEEIYSEVTERG